MTVQTEEPMAGEIVQYSPPAAMEEYRPRIVMAPEEAKALADQLQQCMRAILKEGVDYGPIPGGDPDKKNLNKPGAEKLLQWFGFGSESNLAEIERDDPDHPSGIADKARRIGVTYRTEITKTVPGGGKVIVATCEGYAGYDEDRYYTSAEDAVAKAEAKERFWAAKDKRQPNPAKWANAAEYRAPWNTLIKMSQKRSYVGAAIDATGAAGLFTQDMEDVGGPEVAPAAMSAAGRAAIVKLPQAVATELDAWYRTLNWPDPGSWDAEQWCTALVKAGKLSAGQAASPQPASPAQSPDAPAERTRRSAEDEQWADEAFVKAAEFETPKAGSELWNEIVSRNEEGRLTDDERARLSAVIKAHLTDLRKEEAA